MTLRRTLVVLFLVAAFTPATAHAESSEPSPHIGDVDDIMGLLWKHGLHDYEHERWNVYGQFTWISSFKLPFHAAYTNLNGSTGSLSNRFEHSFTGTLTAFAGVRLWRGAEVYYVPEVIMERPLSNLKGLGGAIQNFELQKTGGITPKIYQSRFYLKQTFDLGGTTSQRISDPQQLQVKVKSRRLVFTFGNYSVLDVLDKNSVSGDLRRGLFNMAFLTYAAYDFAADARGYTWAGTAELYLDAWAFRFVHAVPPVHPNQLELSYDFWRHYGQQLEIEHDHTIHGEPGAVRVLAYRNHENIGSFADALKTLGTRRNAATCTTFHYDSTNATAPDLCWSRKPNTKWGIGVSVEQTVYRDIGIFARGMYSDGKSEVYSYTSADRSLSLGVTGRGASWRRPKDFAGLGYGVSWISSIHAEYLARGGIDGFVGDGALHQGVEGVFEVFYGLNLVGSAWLSGDYQHIVNPGYNRDRGPVDIFGARFHAEF
ncbi:MAG: carbohydrate porin [Polyangia bacterium]